LTGERGHYELAAGRDPKPYITAIENFANAGGMITEQLWDAADLPDGKMKYGQPTGAAMPLCWSHAEYLSLVRSRHDGVCFDRVDAAFQRYVKNPVESRHEIWSLRHPLRQMPRGKILRIVLGAEATIVSSPDVWKKTNESQMQHVSDLNLWFIDFATADSPRDSVFAFTIRWILEQRWEGRNWQVSIV
jgi:glucoamylase